MAEFLLELRSEEIPPAMQKPAAKQLAELLEKELARLGCNNIKAQSFSTPRRIGVMIEGLPKTLSAQAQEIRGPRINAPEKSLAGFRGKHKSFTIEARGDYYYASLTQTARPLGEVLAAELPGLLVQLRWPKSMVWPQSGGVAWVRPLRSILCLFGGKVLSFIFAGCEAGNKTYGHPVDAPKSFAVKNYADYRAKMEKAHILLDANERAEHIRNHAPNADKARIEHLAALSEWPVVCEGKIDKRFLTGDMPDEVLDVVLWKHQQCLALYNKQGRPNGKFLAFADGEKINQDNARRGEEQVITARLADAQFLIGQDLKTGIEVMREATSSILWHEKLGSMRDKSERLMDVANTIMDRIVGGIGRGKRSILESLQENFTESCRYAKADLACQMVQEFPDLQGFMGGFYYRKEKLNDSPVNTEAIADAITQHYRPRGLKDKLPEQVTSTVLAFSDKMTTLAGFFSVGEIPTSSKDPYALRQTALGIIRMCESELQPSERTRGDVFFSSYWPLQEFCRYYTEPFVKEEERQKKTAKQMSEFIMRRLIFYLREQGRPHDLVDSIHGYDAHYPLQKIIWRVEALDRFLRQRGGQRLLTAYRRAAGILRDEEAKDGYPYRYKDYQDIGEDCEGEEHQAERKLREILKAIRFPDKTEGLDRIHLFFSVLHRALPEPIDDFFEQVRINDPDPQVRRNRLCLLAGVRDTMNQFADFSRIQRKPKS